MEFAKGGCAYAERLVREDMKGGIKHQGIVEDVSGDCVRVRIVQTSACAQCHVSGRCSAAESKVKTVDIYAAEGGSLHKGDSVTVVATNRSGLAAVALSYVIPLLVVLATLAATLAATGNEAAAALFGIASLVPYYAILYALRGKISRNVAFRLENH